MKKKRKNTFRIIILITLILIALVVAWPGQGLTLQIPKPKVAFDKKSPYVHISKDGYLVNHNWNYKINEGLDIQGGSSLTYSADLSKIAAKDKQNAMDSLQKVIENRVNAFGVSEPTIYTTKSGNDNRLVVELAGIKDSEQALSLIGKTAQLEFKEQTDSTFASTGITGKDFKRADVAFDPNTGKPYIAIEFNSEGAKKFEEVTGRNIGKPLAVYLDDQLITAPTVQNQISGGKGQITGSFDVKSAKELAIQLNAGSLPVPIKLIEQRTVGASLGQDSIKKSVFAGILGIIVVSLYMIFYYRILGLFSTVGLGLYILFMVALIKLFGVVLTMGGIAGLILSVGMSMETDVLVFERIREELRNGRDFVVSASLGFDRAWPSIKDSNVVSLIVTLILAWLGTGMIRGFAISLGLGIVVGLATTFLGTRFLIDTLMKFKFAKNYKLYRVKGEE